jgi:hypothetical protein
MPQPASGGLNWCQGATGAKAWYVPAGQTVLLMDSEDQKFYIKSTDQTGMPLPIRTYTYTEVRERTQADAPAYATKDELDELRKMIEEMREARHESVV